MIEINTPVPTNIVRVIGVQNTAVSAPADTSEFIAYSLTIPAGTVGPNDFIRVFMNTSANNNANAKNVRLRLGGIGGTQFSNINLSNNLTNHNMRIIAMRGALNSQVGQNNSTGSGLGSSTGANVAGSIDFASDVQLVCTLQKAVAGDTLTLESITVELGKAP